MVATGAAASAFWTLERSHRLLEKFQHLYRSFFFLSFSHSFRLFSPENMEQAGRRFPHQCIYRSPIAIARARGATHTLSSLTRTKFFFESTYTTIVSPPTSTINAGKTTEPSFNRRKIFMAFFRECFPVAGTNSGIHNDATAIIYNPTRTA